MPTHRKWTFRSVQTLAYYRVNCPRLSAHFLVLVAGRCWCDKKKKVSLPLSFALPACAWSKNLSQIAWKFIAFAEVIYEKFLMDCFEPSLTLCRSWQSRENSRSEISFPAHRSLLIVFPKYRNQTIHSPSFFVIRSPNNLYQLFLFPFFFFRSTVLCQTSFTGSARNQTDVDAMLEFIIMLLNVWREMKERSLGTHTQFWIFFFS